MQQFWIFPPEQITRDMNEIKKKKKKKKRKRKKERKKEERFHNICFKIER